MKIAANIFLFKKGKRWADAVGVNQHLCKGISGGTSAPKNVFCNQIAVFCRPLLCVCLSVLTFFFFAYYFHYSTHVLSVKVNTQDAPFERLINDGDQSEINCMVLCVCVCVCFFYLFIQELWWADGGGWRWNSLNVEYKNCQCSRLKSVARQ